MKTGVVAVALAASTLLATAPAHAQRGGGFGQDRSFGDLRGGPDAGFRNDNRGFGGQHASNAHGKVPLNRFGQSPREVKYLTDQAIEACLCQLEIDARRYGFKDATFHETPYFDQVSYNGFVVKGHAKLYDGYNYSKQPYECAVRGGKIADASRLHPARHASGFNRRGDSRFGRGFGVSGISFSFGSRW